jgi:bifunctional oligoribonuclease and PAP phosphatase NrnA
MQNIEALKTILSSPRRIVITTHQRPDADALGSSLGLAGYLKQIGHDVQVVTPTEYPDFLWWMPGNSEVLACTEKTKEQARQKINQAEVIFCLDFSDLSRVAPLSEWIAASKAVKVLIDHHIGYNGFADFALWRPQASAAAELIHEFIRQMGHKHLIDVSIGECLYAGIMTDTGSFKFSSTSSTVHRIVADLIDLGVNTALVQHLIYDNNTVDRMRFLGFSLLQKLIVLPEFKTAYFVLTDEELRKFNYKSGDTEGVVNYALSIRGVHMAAIIIERQEEIRLSFRSFGNFPVNEFAAKHFHGGGHKNAAGGKMDSKLQETVDKFLSLLPEYKQALILG